MNWILISYIALQTTLLTLSIIENKAQEKTMTDWIKDNWPVHILLPIVVITLIVS